MTEKSRKTNAADQSPRCSPLTGRELILGGARSGKSAYAQQRALQTGGPVTYIATARPDDEEMSLRVERHQRDRPPHWTTLEVPLALGLALHDTAKAGHCVIVDCLTLWLSNLMEEGEPRSSLEKRTLLRILPVLPGLVILVSNEVGLGIVPDNTLARQFRDEAGFFHQHLAQVCDRVIFVIAGLPMVLKDRPVTP